MDDSNIITYVYIHAYCTTTTTHCIINLDRQPYCIFDVVVEAHCYMQYVMLAFELGRSSKMVLSTVQFVQLTKAFAAEANCVYP